MEQDNSIPWLCACVIPGSHDKIIKRCALSHDFHKLQLIIPRYYDECVTDHGVVSKEHRLPYLLVHMEDKEITSFCSFNKEVIRFLKSGGSVYHLKPGELNLILSWIGCDDIHKVTSISDSYAVGRSVVCIRGVFKGLRGVVQHVLSTHSCKVLLQVRDSDFSVELPFIYLAGIEEDDI